MRGRRCGRGRGRGMRGRRIKKEEEENDLFTYLIVEQKLIA